MPSPYKIQRHFRYRVEERYGIKLKNDVWDNWNREIQETADNMICWGLHTSATDSCWLFEREYSGVKILLAWRDGYIRTVLSVKGKVKNLIDMVNENNGEFHVCND